MIFFNKKQKLSVSQEEEIIFKIEEIRKNIVKILKDNAYFEGIDLTLIDVGALVFKQVRLKRIMKNIVIWKKSKIISKKVIVFLCLIFLKTILKIKNKKYKNQKLSPNDLLFNSSEEFETAMIVTVESHFKTLIPLIKRLQSANQKILLLLPNSSKRWKILKKIDLKNVKCVYIKDFIKNKYLLKKIKDSEKYRKIYLKEKNKFKTLFIYRGINFFSLVEDGLKNYFIEVIPRNILYLKVAKRILEMFKIKYLIGVRIRKQSDVSFFAMAQKLRIRSATIIHGIISDDLDNYYTDGSYNFQTFVFSWNKKQVGIINKKQLNPKNNIKITGNPQWDSINFDNLNKKDVLSTLNLDLKTFKRVITFCAQPSNSVKIWQDLAKASNYSLNSLLIIKTHPIIKKEIIEKYIKGINKRGNIIIVDDSDVKLYPLLKVSDLMITVFSTTLFESLMLGTPIVLYKKKYFNLVEEYEKYGIPIINNLNQLKQIFVDDKSKEDYWLDCQSFLKEYMGWNVDKISDIINEILTTIYKT